MTSNFYPMPMFVKLLVCNVGLSSDWYQQALGFNSVYAGTGLNNELVVEHLRLHRYQDILLLADLPGEEIITRPRGKGVVVTFTLFHDSIDHLANRALAYGAKLIDGPENKPWNAREFTVEDLDGYQLTFSSRFEDDAKKAEALALGVEEGDSF